MKAFHGFVHGSELRFPTVLDRLYEGRTNLRSECSFVPNQALYQAEPQPEKQTVRIGMASRCAPYFAYLTADSKQIEPMEMVHLIFRYSDLS